MLVVGLTGGIGSGKSTVAQCFAELGVTIIDTDLIAREVVEVGSDALEQIKAKFGADVIDAQGALNRQKMREQVFANPNKKVWLEQLLHPLIRAECTRRIEQVTTPYCIVVIPLLAETGPNPLVNRVLVVDIDEKTQLARASARDGASHEQIKNIIAQQIPREQRLAIADDVIRNDQDIAHLQAQAQTLHEKYLKII